MHRPSLSGAPTLVLKRNIQVVATPPLAIHTRAQDSVNLSLRKKWEARLKQVQT